MAFTIEKVLADARKLVGRLKDHDSSAETIIVQTQALHKQVDSMKVYQENLSDLNEMSKQQLQLQAQQQRPLKSSLLLGLGQENSQIVELQRENHELKEALEEHQTALELIMSKYREQVSKLVRASQVDCRPIVKVVEQSQEVQEKVERIYEMAAVMWNAVDADDGQVDHDDQLIVQLRLENDSMRDLLRISTSCSQRPAASALRQHTTQTDDLLINDDSLTNDDSHVVDVVSTPGKTVDNIHAPIPVVEASVNEHSYELASDELASAKTGDTPVTVSGVDAPTVDLTTTKVSSPAKQTKTATTPSKTFVTSSGTIRRSATRGKTAASKTIAAAAAAQGTHTGENSPTNSPRGAASRSSAPRKSSPGSAASGASPRTNAAASSPKKADAVLKKMEIPATPVESDASSDGTVTDDDAHSVTADGQI